MKNHFTYKLLAVLVLLMAAFFFTACDANGTAAQESKAAKETTGNPAAEATVESTEAAGGQKVFTLDELSKYNGQDGMPAYVAVDGMVYDVSDKPLWAGGEHQNLHFAGTDLSEAILQSPHGKSKLKDLPVVGTLAGD